LKVKIKKKTIWKKYRSQIGLIFKTCDQVMRPRLLYKRQTFKNHEAKSSIIQISRDEIEKKINQEKDKKKKSSIKIKWNKIIRDENENENKSRKE